ncbi:MAG: MtnX-like HAD-IB family phosphatase [Smithellaceae bacterium]|nr:MtnX-like HAD-IB family phosphatase [Smithellaceae bacterium]
MNQENQLNGAGKTLVISDFDGTACAIDLGNSVLSVFAREGWQEIDRSYSANEIGSRNAYGLVAGMIRASKERILEHVRENGRLDPHFPAFYRFCREEGMDLRIVSDGLDFYIEEVLQRHGLAEIPYHANYAVFFAGDRMRVEFPDENELCWRCGTCKTSIVKNYRREYDRIIYIGDSYSDVCAAKEADLVFAKEILLEKCRENGTACIPFTDFSEIERYLRNGGGGLKQAKQGL